MEGRCQHQNHHHISDEKNKIVNGQVRWQIYGQGVLFILLPSQEYKFYLLIITKCFLKHMNAGSFAFLIKTDIVKIWTLSQRSTHQRFDLQLLFLGGNRTFKRWEALRSLRHAQKWDCEALFSSFQSFLLLSHEVSSFALLCTLAQAPNQSSQPTTKQMCGLIGYAYGQLCQVIPNDVPRCLCKCILLLQL